MKPEQIETIARAIAAEQITDDWRFYVIWLLITIVAAGLGSYLGAYMKRRGENLAMERDFHQLLRQLEETTKATTAIKTQIEHADWTKKEYITLKRQKAEALLEALQVTTAYVDVTATKVLYQGLDDFNGNPGTKPPMLAVLYFPEVSREAIAFAARSAEIMTMLINFCEDHLVAIENGTDVQAIREAAAEKFHALKVFMFACSNYIEYSVANSMADLAGVAKPYVNPVSPLLDVPQGWPIGAKRPAEE